MRAGVPMHIELRLSVEDSPNSAGVAVDAIRCAKLALDRGHGGALTSPSAYFMRARRPKSCMGGWGQRFLNVTPSGRVLPCHAAEGTMGVCGDVSGR